MDAGAAGADGGLCAVTVILLSSGDLDMLDRSLDALSRQDVPAPYDILVVDDAFEAATARLVGNWSSRLDSDYPRHRVTLRYHASTGAAANAAAALNQGWRAARSPLIAFAGIDTVPARDWLAAGLAAFAGAARTPAPHAATHAAPGAGETASPVGRSTPSGVGDADPAMSRTGLQASTPAYPVDDDASADLPEAVFGRVDCRLPKHPTETQLHIHARDVAGFAACNWFIRRSALETLGGFDERYADHSDETVDLVCRLLASGLPFAHAPGATVSRPIGPASWGASLLETRRLCSETLLLRTHPKFYRQHLQRPAPPVWHDLAVTAALLLAAVGIWTHQEILAVTAGGFWLVMVAMLCIRRLHETSHTPAHLAEVLLTSPFVPMLALFWRLVGTLRYRTRFARS